MADLKTFASAAAARPYQVTTNEDTGYPEDGDGNALTDRVLLDASGQPINGVGDVQPQFAMLPSAGMGLLDGAGVDATSKVIDSGSNSDGEWVEYADGTIICTHHAASTEDIFNTTNISPGWHRSNLITYPYPKPMTTVRSALMTVFNNTRRNLVCSNVTSSTEWYGYLALPEEEPALTVSINMIAIGKK